MSICEIPYSIVWVAIYLYFESHITISLVTMITECMILNGHCCYVVDVRGCFLTSSLAAALSLTLTIPMSAIADIFVSQVGEYLSLYITVQQLLLFAYFRGQLEWLDQCQT